MANLGERLAAFRKRNGLSQDDLAGKLNVSRQSIGNWESNSSLPSIDYIQDLAKLYGITVDDLLNTEKPIDECYVSKEDTSKEETKDKVRINKDGIFVDGEDETVSVSWQNGIKVKEKNPNGDSDDFDDDNFDESKIVLDENGVRIYPKGYKKRKLLKGISGSIYAISLVIVTVVYIVLGIIDVNYFQTLWPIYFLPFTISGTFDAFAYKSYRRFPIWSLALFIYLFLGSYFNMWHPYWCILIIVPIYYVLGYSISNIIKNAKAAKE